MAIMHTSVMETMDSINRVDAVIHFAGLKAVGESVQKPLLYYKTNLVGTINLLEVMDAHRCKKVVIEYLFILFHKRMRDEQDIVSIRFYFFLDEQPIVSC